MPPAEEITLYAIKPPTDADLTYFPFVNSLDSTADGAWARLCHPASLIEGYESDGFKAVRVKVTIEEV